MKLSEMVGQGKARESIAVYLAAARRRDEPVPHVLITGPSGIGKRTLAGTMAAEMGSGLHVISASTTRSAGDFAGVLTNLQPKDILLCNEIHRLSPSIEELLGPALKEFRLDILIGEGPMARTMKVDLPPFTLVGVTSKPDAVSDELRSHFSIRLRLDPYDVVSLGRIVERFAEASGIKISAEAAREVAARSNGIPRNAIEMVPRLRDFAQVAGKQEIDLDVARHGLASIVEAVAETMATREPIPEKVRMFVWRRDQGKCVKCGSQARLEFDHIIPFSEGGSDTERNIQLLCESCNRAKGALI